MSGANVVIIPNSNNPGSVYYGITTSIGVGTPGGEFHIGTGTTRPLTPVINIFDFARSVYINIPEW